MKQTITFGISAIMITLSISINFAYAQLTLIPGSNNAFRFTTTTTVDRIGFGNANVFPNNTNLPAVLTINSNGLTFPTGEVFRTDAPAGNNTFWRMLRGGTEYGRLFNNTGTNDFQMESPVGNLQLHTIQAQPIIFQTNIANDGGKMLITGEIYPGQFAAHTRVGIGNVTAPKAYLHLGDDIFPGGGYRSWMNDGLYINSTFNSGLSDNMFVGLKETLGSTRTDAIINWGNNPVGSGEDDRLRFVFTANTNGGFAASGADGLEIARMTSDGNTGSMGIGDFTLANTVNLDPQNTLEIRSSANSPKPSGLRFTNLTSGSTPETNPSTNVLSVDANGDVILVPGASGLNCWDTNGDGIKDASEDTNGDSQWDALDCQGATGPTGPTGATGATGSNTVTADNGLTHLTIGQTTNVQLGSNTPGINPLIHNTYIDASTFPLIVQTGSSNIIMSNDPTHTILFDNIPDNIAAIQIDNTSALPVFHIEGNGNTTMNGYLRILGGKSPAFKSIYTEASDPNDQVGMVFRNIDNNQIWSFSAIGNGGLTGSGALPNGFLFRGPSAASICLQGSNVGIGMFTDPQYSLDVVGGGGIVHCYNVIETSDLRYKTNITTLTSSLNRIKQLRGVNFNWQTPADSSVVFTDASLQIGFVAQEVDSVVPEVVRTDSKGFKSIDYGRLTALLAEGIKELKAENNDLRARVEALEGSGGSYKIAPNSQSAIRNSQLKQNVPNPFNQETRIEYVLAENTTTATIYVYDLQGKQVKKYSLASKSNNITIFAGELSAGMYHYALVADNQWIDTKKMILTE